MARSTDRGQVYRRAAERVLTMKEACGCYALGRAHKAIDVFYDIFWQPNRLSDGVDDGWYWSIIEDGNQLAREQRSLALCFMAAMVEAGDA